jgi:hypothetical protein
METYKKKVAKTVPRSGFELSTRMFKLIDRIAVGHSIVLVIFTSYAGHMSQTCPFTDFA